MMIGLVETPFIFVSATSTMRRNPVAVSIPGARNPPTNCPLLNVLLTLLSLTLVAPVKSVQGPFFDCEN